MHRKRLVVLLACSLTAISACKGGNNASPGNNNQDTLPSVDDGSGQQTAPETTPEQPEHQITNLLQPPIRLELPDALDLEYAKISGNARHVLFNQTDPDAVGGSNPSHAKLYDRDLDQVTEATVARDGESINSSSTAIDISTNGQRVLFQSYATNLLGAESIGSQVFLYDNVTGTNILVTRNIEGDPSAGQTRRARLSGNGKAIAFIDNAIDLTESNVNEDRDGNSFNVYYYDVSQRQIRPISVNRGSYSNTYVNDQVLDINLDGNLVLFSLVDREQDTPTLFVYDNNTQTSVSFPLPEVVITAAFSDDGKTIAYAARSEGVDIVKVLDTTNGSTRSLNTESEKGLFPDVSSNGRFVTYTGFNDDQQKIQIYLADLVTGSTILVSQSPDGQPGNARSWPPSFTANGSHLYFGSQASNLVSNDNNSQLDLFLYELN